MSAGIPRVYTSFAEFEREELRAEKLSELRDLLGAI